MSVLSELIKTIKGSISDLAQLAIGQKIQITYKGYRMTWQLIEFTKLKK